MANLRLIELKTYHDYSKISLEAFCTKYYVNSAVFSKTKQEEKNILMDYPAVLISHKLSPTTRSDISELEVESICQDFIKLNGTGNELLSAVLSESSPDKNRFRKEVRSIAPPSVNSFDITKAQEALYINLRARSQGEFYGADVRESMFDDGQAQNRWSLKDLRSALSRLELTKPDSLVNKVPGLKGLSYFGRQFTVFCMHTEEGDMWSVNYLHAGAPKIWYFVRQSNVDKLYEVLTLGAEGTDYYYSHKNCEGFLRHKNLFATPEWLLSRGLQVYRAVQHPGQFMLIKPGVPHWGWNAGDNVAEATNFILYNHLEVISSPLEGYRFRVCRSGLRDFYDKRLLNRCEDGAACGVTMFHRQDFEGLISLKDAPQADKKRKGKQALKGNKRSRPLIVKTMRK